MNVKRTFAVAIAVLGVLMLLQAIGLSSHSVSRIISIYWPSLFVIWGLEEFFSHLLRGQKRVFWPTLLTFLGVVLLLQRLHVPGLILINPWLLFLALILIYIGGSSLLGISTVRIVVNSNKRRWKDYLKKNVNDDWVKKIGDYRYGDEPWELEPLFLTQLAGTVRINLGTAIIPDGVTPIEINGGAGEVRIAVPEGLAVSIKVTVFAGEIRVFERKSEGVSLPEFTYVSPDYNEAYKKVDISIHLKAGEVRIQRVI
jgi:lia operon protein LiaF